MNINIEIYSHELDSALSRLHEWSSKYDWGGVSGNPSFDITIEFIPDPGRLAERVQTDRLLPWEEAFELEKEKNAESKSLLEKLMKNGVVKSSEREVEDERQAHGARAILDTLRNGSASLNNIDITTDAEESLKLMDFLRSGGNRNA